MMFAPRYTVWHCGYLKGEQEMSDTPRTDETQFKPSEEHPAFNLAQYMVKAEFARTLERENATLREQLKDCSAAFDKQQEQLDRNAEQIATLREALSRLIEVHDAMGGMCSPERILAEAALAKEEGK